MRTRWRPKGEKRWDMSVQDTQLKWGCEEWRMHTQSIQRPERGRWASSSQFRNMGICNHGGDHVSRGAGQRDQGHRGERRQVQWCSEVRITKRRLRSNQLAFCGTVMAQVRDLRYLAEHKSLTIL